jgi:HPt (histidine-containing phosphotransfer) domain-containing protein
VLDAKITQRLIDLAPDDPEFFASLVVDFCAAAGAAVGEARARLATQQWLELRRAVHKLKSASATIGALRVHAACVKIEQAAEADLLSQGPAWFENIDEEVGRAADALRAAPGVLT